VALPEPAPPTMGRAGVEVDAHTTIPMMVAPMAAAIGSAMREGSGMAVVLGGLTAVLCNVTKV
jgi:hypothetical protein